MKILKQFTVLLMTVAMVIAVNESFAQNPNKNNEKQPHQKQAQKGKFSYDKIKSMKVAYFTDKLNLTSEEAEKFWPVYNACEKEAFEARKETMKAQRALTEAIKSKDEKSEKEIKQLADDYYSAIDKENTLAKANFAKYQKALPIQKAAMVRILEEQFLHSLVGQMRPGQGPRQAPQGKPGQKPQPQQKETKE